MTRRSILYVLLAIAMLLGPLRAQQAAPPPVKEAAAGKTVNVHSCGSLLLSGQPAPEDIEEIKALGIKRIISLRPADEIDWNEKAAVEGAGLEYLNLPLKQPDSMTDDVLDQARKLLQDAGQTPTMLHCGSANRVGAVWLTHRVLDEGVPLEAALQEAKTIGLRSPEYEAKARDYIQRHAEREHSVRPGINETFLKSDLDIKEWVGRFEVESREIFAARHEILQATAINPGDRVADIGAGTGLFTRMFSELVGTEGWVFAVDIAPRFIEHIRQQAHDDHLSNVTVVLCPEDSVALPPASIDVAFVCDTYHHFEYPKSTLASIYRALRPDGKLIVIDFERIPGTSREFVLEHVRAGKKEFRSEMESAGFEFVKEVDLETLKENYFLVLRKK